MKNDYNINNIKYFNKDEIGKKDANNLKKLLFGDNEKNNDNN